jgi:hypothetical protein
MKKQKVIMLTCRDCYYGVTGLESGVISCLKAKELTTPETANYCPWYNSISKREWSWKEILKR